MKTRIFLNALSLIASFFFAGSQHRQIVQGACPGFILILFIAFTLGSCDQDSFVSQIEETETTDTTGVISSTYIDLPKMKGNNTSRELTAIQLELESNMDLEVVEVIQGVDTLYRIIGSGNGDQPLLGSFDVVSEMLINKHTGYVEGTLSYSFTETNDSMELQLLGVFSIWEYAEFSEIGLNYLEGTGQFSFLHGNGISFFLGNIIRSMIEGSEFSSWVSSSVTLETM